MSAPFILALIGVMATPQFAEAAESLSLRVVRAGLKNDPQGSSGTIVRLILDAESGRNLAALAKEHSGKLASLAIDGSEIERLRVSASLAKGEVSLTTLPLAMIGKTLVSLVEGRSTLTIRVDPAPSDER